MPAIDRSISAQRMTKVRPTAMMPVTETWVRILPTLSSVAKEGLAAAKKPLKQISVRNGAMLRIRERDFLLIAAGQHAQVKLDGRRPDLQLLDLPPCDQPLAGWLQQQARNAIEDADRDVLVDRLLVEEHVAAALGNEGDASSPGLGRAGEGRVAAGDDKPP